MRSYWRDRRTLESLGQSVVSEDCEHRELVRGGPNAAS